MRLTHLSVLSASVLVAACGGSGSSFNVLYEQCNDGAGVMDGTINTTWAALVES